jgi:hypothetical protein
VGKPYELKDQINQSLRATRPNLEGRLIDPVSDCRAREMIETQLYVAYRTRLINLAIFYNKNIFGISKAIFIIYRFSY